MKTSFFLSTILALTPLTLAGGGTFYNNCPVAVYARSGTCENSGHDSTLVQPGSSYTHQLTSTSSGCNRAIKISDSVEGLDSDCYNVEWVVDELGKMWFNLSHDHGNPFKRFRRTMTVDGCEESVQCESGDESCDYPVLMSCNDGEENVDVGEVRFNLC